MKKKVLSLFAIAALVFTLAPPTNVSAKVKISKKSVSITKGKTYTLKVKGAKKKAKWSSSKKSVATVSKKGKVTGKKKGTTTITAKIGKKKYKCKVKVETPSLSATKRSIAVGGKFTLKLNGCSRSKKFYTSNKSVATVSSKGAITAKKKGTAKIRVKISDKSYYCTVSVFNQTPQVGTRSNPANPRNGVTVKTSGGTMYFKLTNTYRGTAAVNQLKSMGEWDEFEYGKWSYYPGTVPVLFVWDVKAVNGYSSYALDGSDIIHPSSLYNSACTQNIAEIPPIYLMGSHEHQDRLNLELYGGASSKMYMTLLVPDGMTSFSNCIYTNTYSPYWIRYNF